LFALTAVAIVGFIAYRWRQYRRDSSSVSG
jgi:hypothetical protein